MFVFFARSNIRFLKVPNFTSFAPNSAQNFEATLDLSLTVYTKLKVLCEFPVANDGIQD